MKSYSFCTMKQKVKQLKNDIAQICRKPGCYTWWFDEDGKSTILAPLADLLDFSKLTKKKIDGKDYYALYFGISKDLHARIKWHISQSHKQSAVKSGYLSTLRQTISALLGFDMTKSENEVNEFMNQHCILEYYYCKSEDDAREKEKLELQNNYYPLNIHSNKGVPKQARSELSRIRNRHKR